MSEEQFTPEISNIREAASDLCAAIVEEKIKREEITNEAEKEALCKDVQRELSECNKRIYNLPYANLEEQSAVLAMLAEHTYMQVMKGRDGDMNAEEISWLVNELQDSVQKLSKTVDRIIKHEKQKDIH